MHLEHPMGSGSAERARRRRGAPRPPPKLLHIPFSAILLAAAVGLAALLLLHREAGHLNEEIVTTGRPARELLGEIQVAFSRRIYTLQEYLLTNNARYLGEYRREDRRLEELNEQLASLLSVLGVRTPAEDTLDRLLASWSSPLEELFVAGTDAETFAEGALARDALHAETLAAMSALRDEINASINARLDRIRALETLQVLISVSLAALALAAALERTRLAGLERLARDEAERRAREEAALREAAAAVASAQTVEETVRRIAGSALSSTGADAALVERIDPELGDVEIVARSGACGPRLHDRFEYAASVSHRVSEAEGPVQWGTPPDDPRLGRYYGRACGGGKLLAVPLRGPERAIGSLILLRRAAGGDFDDEEAERLRVFADLAALEFRRISLLAESEERRRELERVTESRTRLLRGFSHDVKNALGAADGYAQLLEEGVTGRPSAAQHVGIGHLRQAIGSALKLTEDLLHLARVEAGHIQIDWTETDLRTLAARAVETYRPQAEQKGIEMTLEVEEPVPPLRSDPARIQQVLGNLVSNALKYTSAGGHVRVVAGVASEPRAPRPGAWVSMSVIDDGPGIPEEQQSSVFDEFVRLRPDAGAGSGLGLAISRRVAWALHGELTVRSAPGSGCEFTLWLPVRNDAPRAEVPGRGRSAP